MNTLEESRQAENYNFVNDVIQDLTKCKESGSTYDVIEVCVTRLAPIWQKDSMKFVESCPVLDSVGVIELTAALTELQHVVYNILFCDDECFNLVSAHIDFCIRRIQEQYNIEEFESGFDK